MKLTSINCWQYPHFKLATLIAIAVLAYPAQPVEGYQLLSPPPKPIDAIASVPIHQLMTDDWERDPAKESQSKQTFANARHDNAYLLLGYALNRIHQNRTQEAKMACEELTSSYPGNLDGWLLKTWLNTLANDYDVALINMRSMKKQIAATNNLPDSTNKAIYRRLGKLIGYMQGPVSEKINEDLLESTVLAIADGIDLETLKVFNENRDKVLQAYDDLIKEQGAKTQVELAKVKAENEQEAIVLEREVALLEQTESRLGPEKVRLQTEAGQAISALEQQGYAVEQQLNSVSASINRTQLDLQHWLVDLHNINLLPPDRRPSTYFLENQVYNARHNLSGLRSSGNVLSNQIGSINAQIAQTRNSLNQQLRALDKELKKATGSKRRNLAKLAKIAAGPEVADGKKGAMRNKATALRTYDELPIELYRQQLLEQLMLK